MKRTLIVLLSLTLLFLPGCGRKIQPDKYVNYVCYDHLLTSIDVEEKLERAVIERGTSKYNVAYRLLPDISDDQMVYMSVALFLSPITYYIMQNPDNYVNVWTDWTIKK